MNSSETLIDDLVCRLECAKQALLDDTYKYAIAHGLIVRLNRLKNTADSWTKRKQIDIQKTIEQTQLFLQDIN